MVAVRERIRINGAPIEEALFAKYFWEVWDRLEAADKVSLRVLVSMQDVIVWRFADEREEVRGAGQLCRAAREAGLLPLFDHLGLPCFPQGEGEQPSPTEN